MSKRYVEERNGGLYVEGSRVSLDSVVYAFLRGESPEEIHESFPVVNPAQISGALAYYLANREAVDQYLADGREEFARMREASRREDPAFYAKMDEARRRAGVVRG